MCVGSIFPDKAICKLRVKKCWDKMKELDIDAMLLTRMEYLRYFTRFYSGYNLTWLPSISYAVILAREREPVLLVKPHRIEQAKDLCYAGHVRLFPSGKEAETVKEELKNIGIKQGKVGIEEDNTPVRFFKKLQEMLPTTTFVDAAGPIEEIIAIKSSEEILIMEKASSIASIGMEAANRATKKGKLEFEVAAEVAYAMMSAGAEGIDHNDVMSGIGTFYSNPHTTDRRIEDGEFVKIDVGVLYKGYCSGIVRTTVVGKASRKQREIFDIVLRAEQEAIKAIRPGTSASEVDKVAREIIVQAGYDLPHVTGHGIGMRFHEAPWIGEGVKTRLKSGMVLMIEPEILDKDVGGVMIKDAVLVTDGGYKELTTFAKDLM